MNTLELFFDTDLDSASYGYGDLSLTAGDPITSAVLMSLFCRARATEQEMKDQNSDEINGWWGDTGEYELGSKLWLLTRSKLTNNTLTQAKQYIEQALQWMLDDGLCKIINIFIHRVPVNPNAIRVRLQIVRNDGTEVNMNYDDLWAMIK